MVQTEDIVVGLFGQPVALASLPLALDGYVLSICFSLAAVTPRPTRTWLLPRIAY